MEIGEKPALIMDIGGGSIEFIIGDSNRIYWKESYEIGGQRLLDKFHKNDPIDPSEITAIESFLEGKLQSLFTACLQHNPLPARLHRRLALHVVFSHEEGSQGSAAMKAASLETPCQFVVARVETGLRSR